MKYFTLDEAQALIPRFEKIFSDIEDLVARAEAKARQIERLQASAGSRTAELEIEKSQMRFLANRINEFFQQIAESGAMPKGLDPALVDFPFRLGGREVYLCWKLGEKTISHYHGLDDGFAGRRPLPKGGS